MTTPPKSAPPPIIRVKFGFDEGLSFGCGFFIACGVFLIVMVPVIYVLLLLSIEYVHVVL